MLPDRVCARCLAVEGLQVREQDGRYVDVGKGGSTRLRPGRGFRRVHREPVQGRDHPIAGITRYWATMRLCYQARSRSNRLLCWEQGGTDGSSGLTRSGPLNCRKCSGTRHGTDSAPHGVNGDCDGSREDVPGTVASGRERRRRRPGPAIHARSDPSVSGGDFLPGTSPVPECSGSGQCPGQNAIDAAECGGPKAGPGRVGRDAGFRSRGGPSPAGANGPGPPALGQNPVRPAPGFGHGDPMLIPRRGIRVRWGLRHHRSPLDRNFSRREGLMEPWQHDCSATQTEKSRRSPLD